MATPLQTNPPETVRLLVLHEDSGLSQLPQRPAGNMTYSEDVLVTLSPFIETLEPKSRNSASVLKRVETKLIDSSSRRISDSISTQTKA